ncbi:hypothetical protein [Ruania halotolerans]|uniref:hypothetical protein n=1 Tax=Ruania halotolerans TaxID=2897773 RepID=UPI001E591F74|nr:hypothetical protein [Ruania halotolerans]UFU06931.1 hypothetical protein LQF10_02105 [Ruania halotolerans]
MAYHEPTPPPHQEPKPGEYGAVAPSARVRNTPGSVALAVGIAVTVIGLGQQTFSFAFPHLMATLDIPARTLSLFFLPLTVATGVLGLIACIAGGLGLRRRDAPQRAAAAGLALGATAVLSVFIGLIGPAMIEFIL